MARFGCILALSALAVAAVGEILEPQRSESAGASCLRAADGSSEEMSALQTLRAAAPVPAARTNGTAPRPPRPPQLGRLKAPPAAGADALSFDWRAWAGEFADNHFDQTVDHLNAYNQQPKFLNWDFSREAGLLQVGSKEFCNCGWTAPAGACNNDDGSYCFRRCCKSGCGCGWTAQPGACPCSDGSPCCSVCCFSEIPTPEPTPAAPTPRPSPPPPVPTPAPQDVTFKQLYTVNDKSWGGARLKFPIFFVLGAEGGAPNYGAYGHVGEMSRQMRAMVVFIEGRFFGSSLPFGKVGSFKPLPTRVGLLSVEQMLRDFVLVITHIRDTYCPSWECPTVAFGGSMAGTLAAMLRMKFPEVIDMSLASSAPLLGYPSAKVDKFAWYQRVTNTWQEVSGDPGCADLVRQSWEPLWSTCGSYAYGNFSKMLIDKAQYHSYPPTPYHLWGSIKDRCERAKSKKSQGGSPYEVALVLCPECSCHSPPAPAPLAAVQSQAEEAVGGQENPGWDYIACTEIVHPMAANGVTDFFPQWSWTPEDHDRQCLKDWGIEAQWSAKWLPEVFGFFHLPQIRRGATKIIFSYGTFDAWAVFNISDADISSDLPVLVIKGGDHTADMLGSQADDSEEMLTIRGKEQRILTNWINDIQADGN
mmetsp:Transcript_34639/g.95784  ORF Transcript_34639/g.95784 Transcript_34639/m.95784 type:complete len:645 (-) Transcript_34639:195-2129(-)